MNTLNLFKSFNTKFVANPDLSQDIVDRQRICMLVNKFKSLGVAANYDPITSDESRMLLYVYPHHPLHSKRTECNGLIVDYRSNEILCVPPPYPERINASTADASQLVFDPQTTESVWMEDGTAMNMYFYRDEWRFSTARGIDMASVVHKRLSFAEAFCDAMNEVKGDFDDLDKEYSYSFVLSHPRMHSVEKAALWFVSRTNLKTFVSERSSPIDYIPTQRKARFVSRNDIINCLYKKGQKELGVILYNGDKTTFIFSKKGNNVMSKYSKCYN